MTLSDLTQNVKIAYATGLGTVGTGVSTAIDLIPSNIGGLASAIGIVFTLILIPIHFFNGRASYKKTMMEVKILQRDLEERDEKARLWRQSSVDRRELSE